MTAYMRHVYLQQSLLSWSKVRGVELVDFTVFIEDSPLQSVLAKTVRETLPHAKVELNSVRYGVLENPYRAFTCAFSRPGYPDDFVILAEEDVVVSTDVLEYFEWAAAEFEYDQSALGVCAFSRRPRAEVRVEEVALLPDFCPLVWGTWRDRWFNTLQPTWDHDYTSGPTPGVQQGWDWNINVRVRGDRGFVFPSQSRSDHIGRIGGAHCTAELFEQTRAPFFEAAVEAQRYRLSMSPV